MEDQRYELMQLIAFRVSVLASTGDDHEEILPADQRGWPCVGRAELCENCLKEDVPYCHTVGTFLLVLPVLTCNNRGKAYLADRSAWIEEQLDQKWTNMVSYVCVTDKMMALVEDLLTSATRLAKSPHTPRKPSKVDSAPIELFSQ